MLGVVGKEGGEGERVVEGEYRGKVEGRMEGWGTADLELAKGYHTHRAFIVIIIFV